jgi:outer membrane receptor protein involved in Fe transport
LPNTFAKIIFMPLQKQVGLIAVLIAVSISSFTQTILSGSVLDKANRQPIEFASISLLQLKDSNVVQGTTTDKKGKFTLDVKPGNYTLQCTFIGYNKIKTTSFVIAMGTAKYNVGELQLEQGGGKLNEVKVTATSRATLNTSIDRKTYNVENDIMSKSGSASDILKNVPSVEVDIDGNVSLRGSGDVMILINGKPSPLMGRTRSEVLQQLPANSIERIEVITNPSARYRPDGVSGIINIVLKKNIRNGFNGTVTANAGNSERYNGNVNLNYKPKNLNLFGSYSIRQDARKRYNNIDRTNFDTTSHLPASYYSQVINSFSHPVANIVNGGVDYTINSHNAVGASGTYYYRKQTRNDVTANLTYNSSKNLAGDYNRLRYDPEFEKQENGTFYFQHQFPKEDHELRVEFNTSNEDEVEDNHYTNVYRLPLKVSSMDNTLIKQGTSENQLTIDYSNPLTEDSKLEAGYDRLYDKVDLNFYGEYFDINQNRFVKDAVKSNQFIYTDDIHALYATYQKSFEKFGYSVGIRAEQAFTKGHLVTIDSFVNNDYFNIYPTIHLSYKLSEQHELQLNYSKRVHRPEADELNPFPEYQDPRNLHAGNPKLLPEIIHSIEFGYKFQNKVFSFVPSVYYRNKQNGFTSVIVPLNDTTLLSTSQNLSKDQSAGLELIFSVKASKWVSANWSTNVFYNKIDASNLGYLGNKSIYSMTSSFTANITFTKTTMMQVSSNYRSARLTPQGKLYPSIVVNTGIRQDLLKKKMSVTLTASDLFQSLRQRNDLETPYLKQTSFNRRDGLIVYLGVSYRFGVTTKQKEEKLQFDNSL